MTANQMQNNGTVDRSTSADNERLGLRIHLIVTLCVSALLTAINLTLCPQFLWLFFPIGGMGIGMLGHYLGVRKAIRN